MHAAIFKELIDQNLIFGNKRCSDYSGIIDKQTPQITLLTCSDSRVPISCLIDDTLNKAFVIENIGNQVITAAGSLDYGIFHLKTPLFIIMGHVNCGAVTAAVHDFSQETDDIKKELRQIKYGFSMVNAEFTPKDKDWLNKYSEKNVDYQVMVALKRYSKLIALGRLTIIGMMLDFAGSYGTSIRTYITNLNGMIDLGMIRKNPLIMTSNAMVRRLS